MALELGAPLLYKQMMHAWPVCAEVVGA